MYDIQMMGLLDNNETKIHIPLLNPIILNGDGELSDLFSQFQAYDDAVFRNELKISPVDELPGPKGFRNSQNLDQDSFKIGIEDSQISPLADSLEVRVPFQLPSHKSDTVSQPIRIRGSPAKNVLDTRLIIGSYTESEKASTASPGDSYLRGLAVSRTSSHILKQNVSRSAGLKPWNFEKSILMGDGKGSRYKPNNV
jgi:hypothetical protein